MIIMPIIFCLIKQENKNDISFLKHTMMKIVETEKSLIHVVSY